LQSLSLWSIPQKREKKQSWFPDIIKEKKDDPTPKEIKNKKWLFNCPILL
jgi:hypothetical protein